MSIKSILLESVRKELTQSAQGAHTLDHTIRVYTLSMTLCEGLKVNKRVLEAAALLHDIGRPKEEETGISHSLVSGEIGSQILRDLGYEESEIRHVTESIRTHRFSERLEPTSIEGQILSDADKLDAIGAIGIYRAIAQAVAAGIGVDGFLKHADEKLLRLHELMYTEKARHLAEERHGLLESFVNRLREETRSTL